MFLLSFSLLSTACTLLNIQNTALEGAMCLPLTRWSTAPPVCQAGTVNSKDGSIGLQANGLKVPTGFICSNCTRWELLGRETVHHKIKITCQRSTFYWEGLSHLLMAKKLCSVAALKIPGHGSIVNTASLFHFPFLLQSLSQLHIPWRKP